MARFLEFLNSQNIKIEKYFGVDNSHELLSIAKKKFNSSQELIDNEIEISFLNVDLDQNNWISEIGSKDFNLIVAFGVMHHLKDFNSRLNLLKSSIELLNKGGVLIITFWMFKEDEKFFKKHLVKELETKNDYILSFGDRAERFCHYSDQQEIDELLNNSGLEIINKFRSDGFGENMNQYYVMRK